MVKLLIDLGADINAVSNIGHTPVLYACTLMNAEIVKFLVMHGADFRKPTTDGRTCLMIAAQESKEICQILIDNGAEVNAQDSSGYTALHWAITFNNHPDIVVQFLLDHGSDPYVTNKDGDDAFQTASLTGNESTLKQLLLKFKPSMRRKITVLRTARCKIC